MLQRTTLFKDKSDDEDDDSEWVMSKIIRIIFSQLTFHNNFF